MLKAKRTLKCFTSPAMKEPVMKVIGNLSPGWLKAGGDQVIAKGSLTNEWANLLPLRNKTSCEKETHSSPKNLLFLNKTAEGWFPNYCLWFSSSLAAYLRTEVSVHHQHTPLSLHSSLCLFLSCQTHLSSSLLLSTNASCSFPKILSLCFCPLSFLPFLSSPISDSVVSSVLAPVFRYLFNSLARARVVN